MLVGELLNTGKVYPNLPTFYPSGPQVGMMAGIDTPETDPKEQKQRAGNHFGWHPLYFTPYVTKINCSI